MSRKPSPATLEEEAELRMLRERADEAAREAADTLAALLIRVTVTANPRLWAARRLARVRARAAREALRLAALRRPARRAALAAVPVLVVIVGVFAAGRYRAEIMGGRMEIPNGRWYPWSGRTYVISGPDGRVLTVEEPAHLLNERARLPLNGRTAHRPALRRRLPR